MIAAPLVQHAPAKQIDRQSVSRRGVERARETGVVRLHGHPLSQDDADAARPLGRGPARHQVANRRIGRINRCDDAEPVGVAAINLQRVTWVVAVGAE